MLTPQDIADHFNALGIDSREKLGALLRPAFISTDIRKREKEIEDLRAEQAAAMAPFNEQIRPIEADRAEAARNYQAAIATKQAEIDALKEALSPA